MTRDQLEHAIRAACRILECEEIYIVGSQSLLARYPHVSGPTAKSAEVDMLPALEFLGDRLSLQKAANLINGVIGEGSDFAMTHGFIVEGVEEGDLILPREWRTRTHPVCNSNTGGLTGHCLDPHDMAVAKLAAGRPKDRETLINLMRQKIILPRTVLERLAEVSDGQIYDGSTVSDYIARLDRWAKLAFPG